MSSDPSDDAIDVYGSAISYYTGKLEGYLRYKEIPYRFIPLAEQVPPRWDSRGSGAIAIDKHRNEPESPDDEFVYYPN